MKKLSFLVLSFIFSMGLFSQEKQIDLNFNLGTGIKTGFNYRVNGCYYFSNIGIGYDLQGVSFPYFSVNHNSDTYGIGLSVINKKEGEKLFVSGMAALGATVNEFNSFSITLNETDYNKYFYKKTNGVYFSSTINLGYSLSERLYIQSSVNYLFNNMKSIDYEGIKYSSVGESNFNGNTSYKYSTLQFTIGIGYFLL